MSTGVLGGTYGGETLITTAQGGDVESMMGRESYVLLPEVATQMILID